MPELTPKLRAAAERDDVEAIDALIEAGADPNAKNDAGNTALHAAACRRGKGDADNGPIGKRTLNARCRRRPPARRAHLGRLGPRGLASIVESQRGIGAEVERAPTTIAHEATFPVFVSFPGDAEAQAVGPGPVVVLARTRHVIEELDRQRSFVRLHPVPPQPSPQPDVAKADAQWNAGDRDRDREGCQLFDLQVVI